MPLCQYAFNVGDGCTYDDSLQRARNFAPFLTHHMASAEPSWPSKLIYLFLSEIAQVRILINCLSVPNILTILSLSFDSPK